MQLALPCPLHALRNRAEYHAARRSSGSVGGTTGGALQPAHAQGEVLHPGSRTIIFWCLRFHCAVSKVRQQWALKKLLWLSAICMVVFAHGLYCQRSPLVLCVNKKPSSCGTGVLEGVRLSLGFSLALPKAMHIFPGLGKRAAAASQLIHPCMQKRECSILSIYAAHSASFPCRVVPSQKCSFGMLLSCLLGIGPFNSAKSAKTCRRSFETRCNSFCVFSLVFNTCPFFSQELHFSFPRRQEILTEMWSDHLLRQWTPQASQGRLLLAPIFWVVAKLGGGRSGRMSNDTLVLPLANTSVLTLKWGKKRKF